MHEERDKHAAIFPGQGSQEPGMGRFMLVHQDPQISKPAGLLYEHGSDILGQDLKLLCLEASKETLNQTVNAQPAIAITSIAALELLKNRGIAFDATAGHSIGELPALFCAGSLSLEQVLRITQLRAELMTHAGEKNPGKMAAVLNIPYEEIELFCKENGLYFANDNSDTQIVISGSPDGIEKLGEAYPFDRKKSTGSIVLPVSIASHCPLMKSAELGMTDALKDREIHDPSGNIVFVANLTGARVNNAENIRDMIPLQLTNTVRWRQSIGYLHKTGIKKMTEVGHGNIQQRLIGRAHPDITIVSFEKHLGN